MNYFIRLYKAMIRIRVINVIRVIAVYIHVYDS